MSVVQFFLLTLFFLHLHSSILIMLSCRYIIALDFEDFSNRVSMLSLEGPYMATTYHADGNMVCQKGKFN